MTTLTTVQVGQKVHCILYGGQNGVIYAIHGEQRPATIQTLGRGCVMMGGRAYFDVVFDNGTVSRGIPESIVHGVQWRIKPEIATAEEILGLLTRAKAVENQRQLDGIQEATRKQDERQRITAAYSYLEPCKDSKKSSHALGAANLRKELGRAFPGIKFSVRSESYSGGDSIDVGWTDGPTSESVKQITNKYEEGSFDGMTDSYSYDHQNVWPDVYGGAKYVMENRHISKAAYDQVAQEAGYPLATMNDGTGQYDNVERAASDMLKRMAWAKSY